MVTLGINTGFAINRYQTPEEWVPFVRRVGVDVVQLTASLLNPFWGRYAEDVLERTKDLCQEHGVTVKSVFTDALTRVNHLEHPDSVARGMWFEWFQKLSDFGELLGAKTLGSHFGIKTVGTASNEDLEKEAVTSWQKLSAYVEQKGYEYLLFEPMSVPRENAYSIEDTLRLLDRLNDKPYGVPFRVCLDVGHAPHPQQRDPYLWMEKLAKYSPVVHLQQTVLNESKHWGFTADHDGIIDPKTTISTLVTNGLPDDAFFAFELSHKEHWDTEFRVEEDHKKSVETWKPLLEK